MNACIRFILIFLYSKFTLHVNKIYFSTTLVIQVTYCNLSAFVMQCLSSINYLSEIDKISNVGDGDKQFKLKTLAIIRGLNFRGKNLMYSDYTNGHREDKLSMGYMID